MNHSFPSLRVILDGARDGVWNMSADANLFHQAIALRSSGAVLRFYRFGEPIVTAGYSYSKRPQRDVQAETAVVYRPTGGGIVQHGEDLVYALVAPIHIHPIFARASESYFVIHEVLRESLGRLGLRTYLSSGSSRGNGRADCFENPVRYDLMLNGVKIAGAGQRRTDGYFLQQGSIAWDAVSKATPSLKEPEFKSEFARRLSELLQLQIQEIPFNDDELVAIEQTVQLETCLQ